MFTDDMKQQYPNIIHKHCPTTTCKLPTAIMAFAEYQKNYQLEQKTYHLEKQKGAMITCPQVCMVIKEGGGNSKTKTKWSG